MFFCPGSLISGITVKFSLSQSLSIYPYIPESLPPFSVRKRIHNYIKYEWDIS